MQKCPICNFENKNSILYCGNCGHHFLSASTTPVSIKLGNVGSEKTYQLAGLWKRLFASLVDGVLLLPYIAFVFVFEFRRFEFSDLPLKVYLLLGSYLLIVAYVQAERLTKYGQTVGKQFYKIKIVRMKDGENGGFLTNCIMRYALIVILNFIPLFSLVDIGFIFGKNRRCLHDFLAGTCVVDA